MLEQEIPTFNVAADLVILGKRRFDGAMAKWPFYPDEWDIEKFSLKAWEETDFGKLPGQQQAKIAGTWGGVAKHMELRAELQRRVEIKGEIQERKSYQRAIREQTEGKVDLNPANFNLDWGLLCMALVVRAKDFGEIEKNIAGRPTYIGVSGFVCSNLENQLGPIAVVRRGDEEWKTVRQRGRSYAGDAFGYPWRQSGFTDGSNFGSYKEGGNQEAVKGG